MKAKKKTNHLLEEADKIEHIPEEKNNGHEGQNEPIKAKKPRKNWFLARLRKTWARITGCMRSCCTSIDVERSAEELPRPSGIAMEELPCPSGINMEEELPGSSDINMEQVPNPSGIKMEEELPGPRDINKEELLDPSEIYMEEVLPGPSGINMEDSKAKVLTEIKEEHVEEDQNIKTSDNKEAEVVETDSLLEKEIEAENQHLLDLIYRQEDLYIQYYTSQQEILAEYDHIHDQIQIIEDLHIQDYAAKDEEQQDGEELEYKVEDDAEVKIKEDGKDGLEKADSAKESQRASGEKPGPSHISRRDNESSKGKKIENNKGEDNSININEEREECRSQQMSSSESSSLEVETPIELCKSIKTSESGSSDNRSDSSSLDDEALEEISKSIKASQSGSSHDEELSASDICLEKPEQPAEKTPSTVPLTLQSFTFHQKLGKGGFGEVFLAIDIIRKESVAVKVSNKCLFTERGHSFVERNILELSHESPFLIHGLATFHTEKCVYYVLELAIRGDLFDFLHKNFPLDTPTIQFIMAEVICGTQFLHKKNIIHRDLKPANILLIADGHIKITDFGFAVMGVYERVKEKRVGTHRYMAPELMTKQEYGRGVDYFAMGVILYNLFTNRNAFLGKDLKDVKHAIIYKTPIYPKFLTPDTVEILEGLLCKDQDHRLGVIGDIKKHQFFSDMNWEDVETRRVEPPAIMTADFVDVNMDQTLDYMEMPNSKIPEDQIIFKEFSFVCPDWSRQYHPVNNEAIH